MQFEQRHDFPKPKATILKMFSDAEYFRRKYELIGSSSYELLECEREAQRFRIRYRFTSRADIPLPDFVRKFVSETMFVVQQDVWDIQNGSGRLDIEIRGIPVKIWTEMSLEDSATGCTNVLRFNINCTVPLIGPKFEKVLADDVKLKSEVDRKVSLSLLHDY